MKFEDTAETVLERFFFPSPSIMLCAILKHRTLEYFLKLDNV